MDFVAQGRSFLLANGMMVDSEALVVSSAYH